MKLIQSGPRNAKAIVVGEAPGKHEEEKGEPFVGASGEMLDRAIDQANKALDRIALRRSELFITNICHIRPPNNEFEWFIKPKPKPELMLGIVQLKKDIEEIKPNLVIALGAWPLKILASKDGITKWRGSILESTLVKGQKVIATFHPASIFRVFDNHGIFQTDIRRCAEEAGFREISLPQRDFTIGPDGEQLVNLVRELATAEWLSIDIECFLRTDGSWEIACVGFSDTSKRAIVLPYDTPERRGAVHLLCSCGAKKIFQNGQFDITVLEDNGVAVKNVAWDTMYAHHALYPECAGAEDEVKKLQGKKTQVRSALGKGLAYQASVYTKEPFYKDDGKLWKATNDLTLFYTYNAKDAAVTREIRDVQERELLEFGTKNVFEHEMKLQPILMHMTRIGISVDQAERDRLKQQTLIEITRLQDFLDKGAGKPINVKSPDVKWLLFDKLKLPVLKRSEKTDNPSADKYVIEKLASQHPHPLLGAILDIRSKRDDIERYFDVSLDADGRWRALFDPTGTRTGRLASRANIYGTGNNLQNIPERLRRMFVADPGKVLFYADLSQAEARVVAYLARCEALIELFESGRDVHSVNAIRFFDLKCPEDQVEELFFGLRYAAKRVVHGSNYGMQVPRLVESANDDARRHGMPHRITHDVAKRGQDMYFLLYPEIKDNFWRGVRDELYHTRILNTPFNRKRMFFGRWDEKLLNEAYSYIPQSSVGDLTCQAMIDLWDAQNSRWRLPDGTEIMVNGHDSLVGQCWEKDVHTCVGTVKEALTIPMEIHDRKLFIPSDAKVGYNWTNYDEKTNPRGMMKYDKWVKAHAA